MGNKVSLLLQPEEIAQIQDETGFTTSQIERLYSRFTSLDRSGCGTISREDFLRIPELAINPLCDRIVHSFFVNSTDDRVNFRQFMQVLAHFRPIKKNKEAKLNSREEKLKFAFQMYDLDDDGVISREELLNILHMMVGANISQDQLMSIAERTILEADLLLGIIFLQLLYLTYEYNSLLNYWKTRGVPFERPHYLYGSLKGMWYTKDLTGILKEIYDRNRHKHKYLGFFSHLKPSLMIFDHDVAKDILTKDSKYFPSRFTYNNESSDPMTATLFNLRGDHWKNLRKEVTQAFTTAKVKKSFGRMHYETKNLVNFVKTKLNNNKAELDVRELVLKHIINLMSTFGLGVNCNIYENDLVYRKIMHYFDSNRYPPWIRSVIASFPDFFKKFPLVVTPKGMKDFYLGLVENSLKTRDPEGDVDFIMQVFLKMFSGKMTPQQIASLYASFIDAALTTSGSFICASLYELALHPEMQERLRQEICGIKDDLTYDNLKEYEYLENVVIETLRLHHSDAQISRLCEKDYYIEKWDLTIEEGVLVIVPNNAFQMDPDNFPNPETFDPDRFSDPELLKNISPVTFMPFGLGNRNCIAGDFGKILYKLTVLELVKNFEFSVGKSTEVPLKYQPLELRMPDHKVYLKVSSINNF